MQTQTIAQSSSAALAPARSVRAGPSVGERVTTALQRIIPPLIIICAALGIWEAAGRWFGLPDYILPTPSKIWAAFFANPALFSRHAPITILEALLGFGIGNFIAIFLAIAFVHSATVERAVYPMAVGMRSIPFVALS